MRGSCLLDIRGEPLTAGRSAAAAVKRVLVERHIMAVETTTNDDNQLIYGMNDRQSMIFRKTIPYICTNDHTARKLGSSDVETWLEPLARGLPL